MRMPAVSPVVAFVGLGRRRLRSLRRSGCRLLGDLGRLGLRLGGDRRPPSVWVAALVFSFGGAGAGLGRLGGEDACVERSSARGGRGRDETMVAWIAPAVMSCSPQLCPL